LSEAFRHAPTEALSALGPFYAVSALALPLVQPEISFEFCELEF